MNIFFLLLVSYSVVRAVSFAISCLKNKNVSGGVSVFFLILACLMSGYFLIKI